MTRGRFWQYIVQLKGASSRSANARKLKGEGKMPRMNEKTANLKLNKGARELKGTKSEGA